MTSIKSRGVCAKVRGALAADAIAHLLFLMSALGAQLTSIREMSESICLSSSVVAQTRSDVLSHRGALFSQP